MIISIPPGPIDPILRGNRQYGTTFLLGDGEYTTQGAFGMFHDVDVCMLAPGCNLLGNGPQRTRIVARNVSTTIAGKNARYVEVLTGGARSVDACDYLSLSGFTLDCSECVVPTVALHLYATNARVNDVRVTDIVGWRSWTGPVKEGFGILINNPAHSITDGGNSVDNCEVIPRDVGDQENYCTAVYMGTTVRNRPHVYNNVSRVRALALSKAHAAFAANDGTIFTDCEDHGFIRSFFCDTGSGSDVLIQRHNSMNCDWAVDLRAVSEGTLRTRLTVENSRYVFRRGDPQSWAQALLLEAVPNAYIEHVTLKDSTFVARTINASKARLRGAGVTNIREQGCTWLAQPDYPWQAPVLQEGAPPMIIG